MRNVAWLVAMLYMICHLYEHVGDKISLGRGQLHVTYHFASEVRALSYGLTPLTYTT